jgi:hypothetical protein
MKKYLEQRVEELELEVKELKAKIKLNDTKDTSKYLNNYSKYNPLKSVYNSCDDYMYNPSVNLMSEPDLETAFPPYPDIWGSWVEKNHLDVISEDKPSSIPEWGNASSVDETDKDFSEWVKSHEAKNAYEISKRITTVGKKNTYRPFKVK